MHHWMLKATLDQEGSYALASGELGLQLSQQGPFSQLSSSQAVLLPELTFLWPCQSAHTELHRNHHCAHENLLRDNYP
jgi:hypothetical protein